MLTDFLDQNIHTGDFVIVKNADIKGNSFMIAQVIKINTKTVDIRYKPEKTWLREYIWGEFRVQKNKDPKNVIVADIGVPDEWQGYKKACWGNVNEAKEIKKRYPEGYLGKPWKHNMF